LRALAWWLLSSDNAKDGGGEGQDRCTHRPQPGSKKKKKKKKKKKTTQKPLSNK
jgi:hypothetical protein